jgi:hypothetical protein
MGVTYLYPNGPKAPTQAQMEKKYASVHVIVELPADPTPPTLPITADVIHNFQFKTELPPEELQLPLVVVNPIGGGAGGAVWTIANNPDGNSITFGKLSAGAVTLDVWIFRHPVHGSGLFGL